MFWVLNLIRWSTCYFGDIHICLWVHHRRICNSTDGVHKLVENTLQSGSISEGANITLFEGELSALAIEKDLVNGRWSGSEYIVSSRDGKWFSSIEDPEFQFACILCGDLWPTKPRRLGLLLGSILDIRHRYMTLSLYQEVMRAAAFIHPTHLGYRNLSRKDFFF